MPAWPRARCDRGWNCAQRFSLAVARGAASGLSFGIRGAERAAAERIARLIAPRHRAATMTRKGRPGHTLRASTRSWSAHAIGAHGAVLRLEDVRALKETKNRIHRLVNTETANVVRAASAGGAAGPIAYLADAYGLRNLSPALREAAQLRSPSRGNACRMGRRASRRSERRRLTGASWP